MFWGFSRKHLQPRPQASPVATMSRTSKSNNAVVGPKLKLYEGMERLGMPLAHHSCNGFFDGAFGLIQIRQPFADRRRNFINGRSAASQLSNGDPEDPARLVTQEQGLPEPVVSHRDSLGN